MKFRKLGRTGLKVSEIGFGTEHLLRKSRKTVIEIIKEAINHDINYFDIVFNISEYVENISNAIKEHRDQIILTCHLGGIEIDGKHKISRNTKLCEETFLKILSIFGTDYVDLINLQYVKEREFNNIISPGGLLDLAKKLQKEGKANFIGISTHSIDVGQKAIKIGIFDMIMNQVNLVNHYQPGKKELLEACTKEKVGFVAMKPFARGNLLQSNKTVNIASYHTGGVRLTKKIPSDITPVKCLSYVLSHEGVSTTIPGVKNVQELQENLAYLHASEEEKDFKYLLEEFKI
ncbi:MAG: aldo/keto reductase [Promethearchaeota archaeon]